MARTSLTIWAAPVAAATLSPSLSNCYPDCAIPDLEAPSAAAPSGRLADPDKLPRGAGGSLLDYLNSLLGVTGSADTGGAPAAQGLAFPELEIAPPKGPLEGSFR